MDVTVLVGSSPTLFTFIIIGFINLLAFVLRNAHVPFSALVENKKKNLKFSCLFGNIPKYTLIFVF